MISSSLTACRVLVMVSYVHFTVETSLQISPASPMPWKVHFDNRKPCRHRKRTHLNYALSSFWQTKIVSLITPSRYAWKATGTPSPKLAAQGLRRQDVLY